MNEPSPPVSESAPVYQARVPLRWSDMDSLGHVNNAVYFTYCETARMSYFHAIDLAGHGADAKRGPVLATASCTFKLQLKHPATLLIDVRVLRVGRSSFTLGYELRAEESGALAATGESVVVWADYEGGGSLPLPEPLRALLAGSA